MSSNPIPFRSVLLKAFGAFVLSTAPLAASPAFADRALLLAKGDDIARTTLDMIATAKQEIISVEFLMRDDEFGRMKMALLRKRAQEGLKVIVQVDALHFLVHPSYIRALLDAGVDVRVYNKFTWSTMTTVSMRDHTKLLVTDGRYLRTGDSNTGDEYVQWGDGHHMSSRDVYLDGEAARGARHYAMQLHDSDLVSIPQIETADQNSVDKQREKTKKAVNRNNVILKTLKIGLDAPDLLAQPDIQLVSAAEIDEANRKLDDALVEFEKVRVAHKWGEPMKWAESAIEIEKATFLHDPVGRKGKAPGIEKAIDAFMGGAKQNLFVFSPYLLLTPGNQNALKKALKSGAAVQVGTNSLDSSDNITVQSAYEYRSAEYAALGNIQFWEADGPETWHAKMMERDGQHLMIMSYNIDWRSMTTNMETGLYIRGKLFVSQVREKMEADKRAGFTKVAENGQLLPAKFASIRICRDVFSSVPRGSKKMTPKFVIKMIEKKL